MIQQHKIILQAFFPLIFLYLFNWMIDSGFRWYDNMPLLDVPMHFIGGYMVAVGAWQVMDYYISQKKYPVLPAFIRSIFLIGIVCFVSVGWEGYEWMHDQLFPRPFQLGPADMLGDIAMGLIGAAMYSIVLCLPRGKTKSSPVPIKRKITKKTSKKKRA